MFGRWTFAFYSGPSWILLSRALFTHRGRTLTRHRSPTIVRGIARIRFPPNEKLQLESHDALYLFLNFSSNFSPRHPSARRNSKRSKREIQDCGHRGGHLVEGKHFYELIRRNKSGDRSGNELRCINDGRHGTGVANAACPTSLPLLLTATFRWGRGEKDNSPLGHLPFLPKPQSGC